MDKQSVLKKGYLRRFNDVEHQWDRQYYVLYDSSGKSAARLDWHATEATLYANPSIRSGIYLEEIEKIEVIESKERLLVLCGNNEDVTAVDIRTHFAVHSNWTGCHLLLGCENIAEVNEWKTALERLMKEQRCMSLEQRSTIVTSLPSMESEYRPRLTADEQFDVEIEDTAAATRCELNGKYRLVLTNEHVTLIDSDTRNTILTWMYKSVRRYGLNANCFILEGGRSANPAHGLFIFKNCNGHKIREVMEAKMKAFRQRSMDDSDDVYSYAYLDKSSQDGGGEDDIDGSVYTGISLSAASKQATIPDVVSSTDKDGTNLPTQSSAKPSIPPYTKPNKSLNKPQTSTVVDNPVPTNQTVAGKAPAPTKKPPVAKKLSGTASTSIKPDADQTKKSGAAAANEPSKSDSCLRMSEVLHQLANQTLRPAAVSEDPYGYSQLDIRMDGWKEKVGLDERDGHLYGQKLVQQLKKEEDNPYEELSDVKY